MLQTSASPDSGAAAAPFAAGTVHRCSSSLELAEHPCMLTIERIVRMAPKMTEVEREALADWLAEALESPIPIDTSGLARECNCATALALSSSDGFALPLPSARVPFKPFRA